MTTTPTPAVETRVTAFEHAARLVGGEPTSDAVRNLASYLLTGDQPIDHAGVDRVARSFAKAACYAWPATFRDDHDRLMGRALRAVQAYLRDARSADGDVASRVQACEAAFRKLPDAPLPKIIATAHFFLTGADVIDPEGIDRMAEFLSGDKPLNAELIGRAHTAVLAYVGR